MTHPCPDCGQPLIVIRSYGTDVRLRCWCNYYALGRLERGQMPDIQTFFQLCQWMLVDPSQFVLVESDEE